MVLCYPARVYLYIHTLCPRNVITTELVPTYMFTQLFQFYYRFFQNITNTVFIIFFFVGTLASCDYFNLQCSEYDYRCASALMTLDPVSRRMLGVSVCSFLLTCVGITSVAHSFSKEQQHYRKEKCIMCALYCDR